MSKKLEKTKNNKKSEVYENDEYKVRISDINKYFLKKNGTDYTDYDHDLEDNEYKFVKAVNLEITNKSTGKQLRKDAIKDIVL